MAAVRDAAVGDAAAERWRSEMAAAAVGDAAERWWQDGGQRWRRSEMWRSEMTVRDAAAVGDAATVREAAVRDAATVRDAAVRDAAEERWWQDGGGSQKYGSGRRVARRDGGKMAVRDVATVRDAAVRDGSGRRESGASKKYGGSKKMWKTKNQDLFESN
eukprot:TRINITY_DN430_c1_g1_i4.p1 TRINITY_DN430_c1_g1~~TRINITY_DN430_c1_g1_i4.p1  ORF type:complete len:185 (-),score=3.88 TRINITY_DN430_c1_g1_i4:82-561(-)